MGSIHTAMNSHAILRTRNEVQVNGYSILHDVLNTSEVSTLAAALEKVKTSATAWHGGSLYAMRNLLDIAEIQRLAASAKIGPIVELILGPDWFPVKGTLFDKGPRSQLEGSLAPGPSHRRARENQHRRFRTLVDQGRCNTRGTAIAYP